MAQIKKPRLIIKWSKGWFQALGLHHGLITIISITIFSIFNVGYVGALLAIGWYARHEWGGRLKPPEQFEILDFVTPSVIALAYLIFWQANKLNARVSNLLINS